MLSIIAVIFCAQFLVTPVCRANGTVTLKSSVEKFTRFLLKDALETNPELVQKLTQNFTEMIAVPALAAAYFEIGRAHV